MKNKETVWYVMPGLPGPKGQMPTLCYVAVVSEKEAILIWSPKDSHNKRSRQFSNFFWTEPLKKCHSHSWKHGTLKRATSNLTLNMGN